MIHNRRSVRLHEYDYSQKGLYFITICTCVRCLFFGDIVNGKMLLNEYGRIADNEWITTPNHRPYVIMHEYIVMPDHLHGIIEIIDCH
jgi:REP element-mobilizing transposase RayT